MRFPIPLSNRAPWMALALGLAVTVAAGCGGGSQNPATPASAAGNGTGTAAGTPYDASATDSYGAYPSPAATDSMTSGTAASTPAPSPQPSPSAPPFTLRVYSVTYSGGSANVGISPGPNNYATQSCFINVQYLTASGAPVDGPTIVPWGVQFATVVQIRYTGSSTLVASCSATVTPR